jgi:hypothetical protein
VSIAAKFTGPSPHHLPNRVCGQPNADYSKPVIFGLLSDRKTVACLDLPGMSTDPNPPSSGPPTETNGSTYLYNDSASSVTVGGNATYSPFQVPPTNRVHSIFMDPTGTTTYVVDTSQATDQAGATQYMHNLYGGGIYSSNDIEMLYPIESFTVRAIAFSK